MKLIDLDAKESYLLDGKYSVSTIEKVCDVTPYTANRIKELLTAISEAVDVEHIKARQECAEKEHFSASIKCDDEL